MPLSTRRFDALRAKGLGVDGQLVGEVRLQDCFELLLLRGGEVGQKLGDQVEADVFDLPCQIHCESSWTRKMM